MYKTELVANYLQFIILSERERFLVGMNTNSLNAIPPLLQVVVVLVVTTTYTVPVNKMRLPHAVGCLTLMLIQRM